MNGHYRIRLPSWNKQHRTCPLYRPCVQERLWRITCSGIIAYVGSRTGPFWAFRFIQLWRTHH